MKARMLVALLIADALGLQAGAQTNTVPVTNAAPIVTTNFVTAVRWFREVNGQLYNTERSVLWKTLWGRVAVVLPGHSIVLEELKQEPTAYRIGAYTGRGIPVAWENVPTGQEIFLIHCPTNLAVGDELEPRAMATGTTNYDGQVLRLYDCGTPHVIAVVTTNDPQTFKAGK